MDVFERLGLGRLIDSSLGKKEASWNAFRYSEVTETLFCNYLCGGDCLEDINMLAPQLALSDVQILDVSCANPKRVFGFHGTLDDLGEMC